MSRDLSNGLLGPFPIYWPDVKPAVREALELLTEHFGVKWELDGDQNVLSYKKGAGRISMWLQLSSMGHGSWGIDGIVDDMRVCSIYGPREPVRGSRSESWTPQSDILDAVQECWSRMGGAFDREPTPKETGGEWRSFRICSSGGNSATALLKGGTYMNIHGVFLMPLVAKGWVRLRVVAEENPLYKYRVLEIQNS